MSERRVLFHNDARHSYIYYYDPPMRLEEAWKPVDEIVGTGVDTLIYGLGAGPTMFHDTDVGERWGTHIEKFQEIAGWRAYENLKSLRNQGFDPLNILINRAQDKGIEFFVSLRMSHPADPSEPDDMFTWTFRNEHPEWCLKGPGKFAFDWTYPEVRAERFALIEETVNKYDIDGFEVDWTFWPHYFEDDAVQEKAQILTRFMVEARKTADLASESKGKKILIGARVLPTLKGNTAAGIDVTTWIKTGLVDFVIPTIYEDMQLDSDFPFEWLVELSRGTDCCVYPSLQTHALPDQGGHANLKQYRAGAAAYWAKGADGIHLPWFKWPHGAEERAILSEIRDPNVLAHQPKHYFSKPSSKYAASYGYDATLPMSLAVGTGVKTATIFIADDFNGALSTLRLITADTTSLDEMTVTINDVALDQETVWRRAIGYLGEILDYRLKPGLLITGLNTVGVEILSRPHNLGTESPLLNGIEVIIDYPKPTAQM